MVGQQPRKGRPLSSEAAPVCDLEPGGAETRQAIWTCPRAPGRPDACLAWGAWFLNQFTVTFILVSTLPEGFLNRRTNANLTTLANKTFLGRIGFRWCLIITADTKE